MYKIFIMAYKKSIWILFVFLWGTFLVNAQIFNENTYKLSKVLDWIDSYYVDSVDQDELIEKTITYILKELDPHSTYISKEEVQRMNEPLEGEFEGIGISFNILYDTLYVISPISGGPSEKVGIQAGDRIIEIDGENVAGIGLTNSDVFSKLRGKKGTKVDVSIMRRDNKKLVDYTITRDKIPIFSVDASYMIDDETGYIKVNRFASTTLDEFQKATEKLKEQNVKNLILDLQGNGGGYLDMAVKLADEFLSEDKLIVYTDGINSSRREYKATEKGSFEKGKVVVLMDEGSASASEIVAGALQDWDRAVIIGRRSFGKGLVQRQLMLPDGAMLRLTIARYYTPTGRLIQKPYNEGYDAYVNDLSERNLHGEFFSQDSIQLPDSLKYYTLEKRRTVYGGGGIMPNIFVPIDTSDYSDYYRDLIRTGVLYRFSLNYVDKNRKNILSKYKTFENFNENFSMDEKQYESLFKFAQKEGINVDEEGIEISKEKISSLYKAYLVRDIWDSSNFFEVLNEESMAFQKAMFVINNWDKTLAELDKD